jgi:26S proteasome regulatory subunit N3
VVAKAIHDGVIEAVIDRPNRFVFCKSNTDVYTTTQPQSAFHKRIEFCNTVHNEAVKALTFPAGAHKSKILDLDLGDLEDEDDLDPETKDKPPLVEDGHDH